MDGEVESKPSNSLTAFVFRGRLEREYSHIPTALAYYMRSSASRAHEYDAGRVMLNRCSMINIDPQTGDASGVALKVLAGYRRERANILFGQFLALDPLSTRPSIQAPLSDASAARSAAAAKKNGTAARGHGATGGRFDAACTGDISGDETGGAGENSAGRAPAAEGEVVDSARRRAEVGDGSVSPDPSAVGGWKFWVSEGMEVAGEG